MNEQELIATLEKISNWGRWGTTDQRGALNYITPQKRAAAMGLAQSGATVSLALPLNTEAAADNAFPALHLMQQTGLDTSSKSTPFSSDFLGILYHGYAHTHLDALCHVFWRGKMYNGFDATSVGSHGGRYCTVDRIREGIIGRGVLLDIPRLKQVEWLENGAKVTADDLEAAERAHHVRVEEGDILLVRVGRAKQRQTQGAWNVIKAGMAGLDPSCLPWLHERRVAMLGSDGVSDAMPSGFQNELWMPIHTGTLVMMGIPLLDNADLEELAESCARFQRYAFTFILSPLVLKRGTGSPANPLAVF